MDRDTYKQSHLDYTRVSIEVNVEDVLDEVIRVNMEDDYIMEVPVTIPWMPGSCPKCKQFGHFSLSLSCQILKLQKKCHLGLLIPYSITYEGEV